MRDKREEQVSQIHHAALSIAAQAYLCVSNRRVGREWLLQMKYSAERITKMIEKLEK